MKIQFADVRKRALEQLDDDARVVLQNAGVGEAIVRFGIDAAGTPMFKAAEDDSGVVEGYASTSDLDEMDDIIEPTAYTETLARFMQYPAMMLNHRYDNAIGKYTDARIDTKGLWVRGQVSEAEQGVRTKVKEKVYRAFSISGIIKEAEWDSERQIRTIKKIELYEISIVWLPANRQARIDVARSLASAFSNGEFVNSLQRPATGNKEATAMGAVANDELKALVQTEVGALKQDLKDHMGEVSVSAAREHVDYRFLSLRESIAEVNRLVTEVKEKSGTFVSESEWKVFKDKVAADLAPLAEVVQRLGKPDSEGLPWLFETDSLTELMDRKSISLEESKFCEELGTNELLFRLQTCDPSRFSQGMAEGIKRFQDDAMQLAMIHCILSKTGSYRDRGGIKSLKRYQRLQRQLAAITKGVGMDTATAGEGLEWVPTVMAGDVVRRIENEAVVAALFQRATMPSKTWDWPVMGAGLVGYSMPESTSNAVTALLTSSVIGTAKATFTAVKIGGWVPISSELTEDAVASNVAIITEEIILGMTRCLEDAVINSDSTNIGVAAANQDNDITAAQALQKRFASGLRKKALAGTVVDGGANPLSVALLRQARKGLSGARSVKQSRLAHIMSSKSYINLLDDEKLITMDKFGAMATVLTGFLAAVDGIPVVVSDYIREDIAASGVNTAAGPNDKTISLTVQRDSWAIGDRRAVQLKSDQRILTDSLDLVATWRGDLEPLFSTTPVIAVVNLAP